MKAAPRTNHHTSTPKRIFLSPPHMGGEELPFIQEAFDSNYIAPVGPMVDAFEQEFGDKVGISHALAVSSGTAAMPQWNSFMPVKWASTRQITRVCHRAEIQLTKHSTG